jgi:hypothetical protein
MVHISSFKEDRFGYKHPLFSTQLRNHSYSRPCFNSKSLQLRRSRRTSDVWRPLLQSCGKYFSSAHASEKLLKIKKERV